MRYLSIPTFLLLSVPLTMNAQKQEIREMQRDLATLQDQVKTLQRTLDEKVGALTSLLQQALDNTNKMNTALAILQSGVSDRLNQQEKSVGGPIAGMNAKLDQLTDEVRAVRENVTVVNNRMDKLQTQLSDVERAVRTISAPPPPPSGGTTTTPPAGGSASAPPAGVTATSLYDNARRDFSSGQYDLALQQFTDFLRWFPTTDLAPNAQFYIGMVHYNKGEMDSAVQAFDQVLTAFPENNKSADAMFMKGESLLKQGKKTASAEEFRAVIKKYPGSDQAAKATVRLKSLGYNPPVAAPKSTTRRRK